jgi:hypothetical protein
MRRWMLPVSVALVLFLLLLGLLTTVDGTVLADGGILYVAPEGECGGVMPCYPSAQPAVDAAQAGDEIRVATGVYTDVSARRRSDVFTTGVVSQVLYITKTLTIRGGYTTEDWTTSNPAANPTTLDAQGRGRVFYVSGEISPTIEGFRMVGGNAAGMGGFCGPGCYDGGGGGYIFGAETPLLHPRPTLLGNEISESTATYGGGLVLYGTFPVLVNNAVISNTADNCGGLVVNYSPSAFMGNRVSGNAAGGWGGGLCAYFSRVTFSRDTITGNIATQGGGVWLTNSRVRMVNSVIADNRTIAGSRSGGSGMYIEGTSADMTHVTIARNEGPGGDGLYVKGAETSSTLVMTNTIVANQMVGISVLTGRVTVNAVLWFSTPTTILNVGGDVHTPQLQYVGDPAFGPDGYHLGAGSAASGRAVDAGVAFDIDGEPRLGLPDLGADEYWAPGSLRRVYLPLVVRAY